MAPLKLYSADYLGTLLCVSSGGSGEFSVELSGDVSLQAAADFPVRFAFGSSFGDVGVGFGAAAPPGEGDVVQRSVEDAVPAAIEPVADGLPATGRDGTGPGQ